MKGTIDVAQRQRRGAVGLSNLVSRVLSYPPYEVVDSAVSVRKSCGGRVLVRTLCYDEIARIKKSKNTG